MDFQPEESPKDLLAEPFLSWLPVEDDNNKLSKLMELVEDEKEKKNSVGFIGNRYWPRRIFHSASSCIKGNVEINCGTSLSDSGSPVLVSAEMAGILDMEPMLFGVDMEEGEGSWDPFPEPEQEPEPELEQREAVKSADSDVSAQKIETIIMEDSIEELEWNDEVLARFFGEDYLQ